MIELSIDDLMELNGGASVGEAVAAAIGFAAILWAAPVALVVSSTSLGVGMVFSGVGAVVNLFTSNK